MKKTIMTLLLALVATMGLQAQIIKPGQGKKMAQGIKDGFNDVMDAIKQDTKPTGTHEPLDFYMTPKLGLNVSTLTSAGGNPQLGLTAGVNIETFVTQRLSVGLELLYSHQGTSGVTYSLTDANGQAYEYGSCKYSLGYLGTNLLARYYPKACLPFSVYSGLCIQRCVNGKWKSGEQKVDLIDDSHIHKGDLAIPLGASYEVGQWAFDLRFTYSPTRLAKSERAKEILGNASNLKLEATVGYRINVF